MNPLCRITPRHTLHALLLWLICLSPLQVSAQTPESEPDAQSAAAPTAAQPSFEQLVQLLAGGSL